MARAVLVLHNADIRRRAVKWIETAPDETRVEFRKPVRTLPQNDHMWELLTNISWQHRHGGDKLAPEDWKLLFLDALTHETRVVPSLDGDRYVALRRSSELDKEQGSQLIELILAYCAHKGIDPYLKESKHAPDWD